MKNWEELLEANQKRVEKDKVWQDTYQVGGSYKELTIICVDRTGHRIQVVMEDGSTDWIDLREEI